MESNEGHLTNARRDAARLRAVLCFLFIVLSMVQAWTKPFDSIAVVFLAVALVIVVLPHLPQYIKSIELSGLGKVELLERKVEAQQVKVDEQEVRLRRQQQTINDLVVYSLAFYLYEMLRDFYKCEQGTMPEYLFRKSRSVEDHLRYLRDHGYLEMTFKIAELQDGENIAQRIRLTPAGKLIVELREQFTAPSGNAVSSS